MNLKDALETPLQKNQSLMAIMNVDGDQKITWDRTKPEEVESTRAIFNEWKKRGYMAYKVTKGGERGEILHGFDPAAQTIIFAPPLKGGRLQ